MLALTGSLRYYFVDGVTDMRLAYILYVKALERELKFMKVKSNRPVLNEDGSGLHYQIKWKHLVLLLSCPVRNVIRI
jgi:hypothetical protein